MIDKRFPAAKNSGSQGPGVPHRCDVSSHIEAYFGALTDEAERAEAS